MQLDGLLQQVVDAGSLHLTVTERGRAFLRQICAALDPYQQARDTVAASLSASA